ncbi:glycosyltransferase family 39 protein [Ruficoccus sp. ZRK36]|uniref:ArnT family glycosyltransferase n=1 Tax=Ruficoccus sp. ZRK36 TaxID=2866311 RepID=UPI001C730CCC|nr:glycosyltransferase family 39 protein [Ruficoccus sp. ZRK36]QYY34887.1 glycosyltransferase family 39 protein [Ruficoccus sp. ZRK36]
MKKFIRKFADEAFLKRWAWLLLLVIAALTLTGGTATLPLIDRDEPRFAEATIEMMQTDQWVIPYFNGEYRFDKPPLTYWWMRVNYWIFGTTEFAARLHSMLAGYLCALAIFGFGTRLYDARAGLLAGLGWLTCLQVMIHSRMSVADMPMVLAVILVQWAAWELLMRGSAPMEPKGSYPRKVTDIEKKEGATPDASESIKEGAANAVSDGGAVPHQCQRRHFAAGWFWMLWLGMAMGFLAKGPIVFFVPLLAWLLWRWVFWRGHKQKWGRLHYVTGSLIFLVVIGLWGIPALMETHGLFWDKGMGEHVVERGFKSFNDRLTLPFYYPLTAFISLMPWVAFAWWGVVKVRRNWDGRAAYLLSWLVAPFIIFTFYATQLPHYTMPGFAAFFLLLFSPAQNAFKTGRGEKIFYWCVNGIWLIVLAAIAYVLFSQKFFGPAAPLRLVLAGAAVVWLGLLGIGFSFRKPSIGQMVFALFAIWIGTHAMAIGLRAAAPAPGLTQVFAQAPADTQWRAVIYQEPSLVFYSGESYLNDKIVPVDDDTKPPAALKRWKEYGSVDQILTEEAFREEAMQPTGTIGLVREWRLEDFAKTLIGQPLVAGKDYEADWDKLGFAPEDALYMRGINFARMSWIELIILRPEAKASTSSETE